MKKNLVCLSKLAHSSVVGSAGTQPTQDSRQPDPARTPTRPGLFVPIWPYFAEGVPDLLACRKSIPLPGLDVECPQTLSCARLGGRAAPLT